ncbi:hypothetical protein E2C01_021412 [Portunus trituberculatus]|uniref:Uncharacterized protein n=1 Tax=Portunus trituberculatus TaxID=210409 RepID=A0A5B7E4W2_PORTR|nr:hypothetical protein [Portunus trituberculatus]
MNNKTEPYKTQPPQPQGSPQGQDRRQGAWQGIPGPAQRLPTHSLTHSFKLQRCHIDFTHSLVPPMQSHAGGGCQGGAGCLGELWHPALGTCFPRRVVVKTAHDHNSLPRQPNVYHDGLCFFLPIAKHNIKTFVPYLAKRHLRLLQRATKESSPHKKHNGLSRPSHKF